MIGLNKVYLGDTLELTKSLPDCCVDSVITSPPYWQLRDYGYDGQWGLEPTYIEYLEHLWSLMDEIYRVLKDDGTAWINLGDTYGTLSGGIRGLERAKKNGGTISKKNIIGQGFEQVKPEGMEKCLLLIPHRFAIGCIERGWILRNDIVWAKRNAMPESVTDRFSKKHEYFFLMSKKQKYYFDLNGIRDKNKNGIRKHTSIKSKENNQTSRDCLYDNPLGKNPGSVSDFWDIPTKPNSTKHYATFNTNLIDKPIIAGCPKGGIVLDPFCGTGTTGARAIELGRNFIGFDGSQEYVDLANKRLEPHLNQTTLF